MSGFGSTVSALGPAMSIAGTVTQAYGQRAAGRAAQAQAQTSAQNAQVAANFEAGQADYLAGQSRAIAQREAYEQRKTAALLSSKALANAAASGAGASDPTVVDLINGIQAEGTYRAALAMYEGEEQARNYTVTAQARRLGGQSAAASRTAEGESIARASNLSMFSTLLRGSSSLLDRYGGAFSRSAVDAGGY